MRKKQVLDQTTFHVDQTSLSTCNDLKEALSSTAELRSIIHEDIAPATFSEPRFLAFTTYMHLKSA